MTYATPEQMEERFGQRPLVQLTDRDTPPAGTVNATVLARALDDTDAMINGYVASRYALPLASTPATLRDIALAIAFYKLHRSAPTEKARDDYRDALKQLADIAGGRLTLDLPDETPAAGPGHAVRASSAPRRFTDEALDGY